jgi:hypothetical protein
VYCFFLRQCSTPPPPPPPPPPVPAGQDTLKVTLSALEKSELAPAFTR